MKFAYVVMLIVGFGLWLSAIIALEWVLNYAVYHGMSDLWIAQIPFTNITIYWSAWQTYLIAMIELHIALALIVFAIAWWMVDTVVYIYNTERARLWFIEKVEHEKRKENDKSNMG